MTECLGTQLALLYSLGGVKLCSSCVPSKKALLLSQMILVHEWTWNHSDMMTGDSRISCRKTCPTAASSIFQIILGSNSCLRDKLPVPNRFLSTQVRYLITLVLPSSAPWPRASSCQSLRVTVHCDRAD